MILLCYNEYQKISKSFFTLNLSIRNLSKDSDPSLEKEFLNLLSFMYLLSIIDERFPVFPHPSIIIPSPFVNCISKIVTLYFLSFKSNEEKRKKYVDYILKEIDLYPKYEYDTVYLGGGTPSLLNCEDVERIIKKLNIKAGAEITLEVNPKTVNLEKLKGFKKAGINRVSIGIQTFDEKMLQVLGRMHNSNEGIETYYQARETGFDNISLDLMFSLPNQSIEKVKQDLERLLELRPEHFSIYSLIWEEGTAFFKKLEEGVYRETDNDLEAQMFEYIIDRATEAGYIHYEISNFCLPRNPTGSD